jgi:hypothetical protein
MKLSKTFLYVAFLLILLIIVNAFLSPVVIKELFVNNDDMPLKALNNWNAGDPNNLVQICGRNLKFPYFKNTNILASQRALPDPSIKTIPEGICRYSYTPDNINDSYSIIYENGLFYTLKRACIRLNVLAISLYNDQVLNILFNFQNGQDITNLAILYLLNPLWVEFIPSTNRTTLAYTLIRDKQITTASNTPVTARFQCILPYSKGGMDDLFNYQQLSSSQTSFTQVDANTCLENQYINLNVYYLDSLPLSFQTTGRFIVPTLDRSGSFKIFDPSFDSIYDSVNQSEIYQFMNNINLMYKNYTIPVFTFEMNISLYAADRKIIAQCYMDNSVGSYNTCSIPNNIGPQKNNIFMIGMLNGDGGAWISIFTGRTNNSDCGTNYNVEYPSIFIPYVTGETTIKLICTVSPYSLTIYAEWKDILKGDTGKKFSYDQKPLCKEETNNNALYKLFSDKSSGNREPLSPIYFKYIKENIINLNRVTLGYTNYYTTYNT